MAAGSIPKPAAPVAFAVTATKCLASAASSRRAPSVQVRAARAFASVSRVVNVFEQMTNSVSSGIEIAERTGKRGGIDVEDEADVEVVAGVVAKGTIGHPGAEVGAANPDVDDRGDPAARMTTPVAGTQAVGEYRHPVEHLVHVAYDVAALNEKRRGPGKAESGVERGSSLRDVHRLAAEHRLRPATQPRLVRETAEQANGLAVDPVLRVVEVEPARLEREPLAPAGITRKQPPQVASRDLLLMALERLPGRTLGLADFVGHRLGANGSGRRLWGLASGPRLSRVIIVF